MAFPNAGTQSRYQEEAGDFLATMGDMAPQIGLDYSVESLQRLEEFISEHFDASDIQSVDETLLTGIGSYVGEVIIRHIGGYWNPDGQAEIDGLGPVIICPIEKTRQRFTKGREHSLAWYYHTTQKQAYEAGMIQAPTQQQVNHQANGHKTPTGGLLGMLKSLFGK